MLFFKKQRAVSQPSAGARAFPIVLYACARSRAVTVARKEIYHSPNGDRWFLARNPATGHAVVLHEPNLASGGKPSQIQVGYFLARSAHGPEHQELLRLIGTLVDDASDA
jgi:hypothetical protein